jgi:hypothetical protein
LHVARADLDHVGRFEHGFDVARVHQLGDDRQAGRFLRLAQDLERVEADALEGVRGRARLERAAAEPGGAGGRDRASCLERLLAVLDRARSAISPK